MLRRTKSHLIMLLVTILLIVPVTAVNASWGYSDAIDGIVYCNGVPAAGVEVHVYNADGYLEGYGVDSGLLGIEFTNSTGGFRIAYLYAHGGEYTVKVFTPCGELTETVNVYCGQTTRVDFYCIPPPGTGTPGYWKNHPEAWPVEEITIGGVTYSKDAAIEEMWAKKNKDKTYTMFAALVSAKLNVLIGNPSGCVDETIADADAWMAEYGPVGSGVRGNSEAWKDGEPLYLILDDYNNGLLCAPHRD